MRKTPLKRSGPLARKPMSSKPSEQTKTHSQKRREMRDVVFARFGGKCVATGTEEALTLAHILRVGSHPSMQHDPDNAVPLTWDRHVYFNTREKEWRKFIESILPGRIAALLARELEVKKG